jgi:chaperonin GroES
MRLQPVRDAIFAVLEAAEETSKGGIIVPDTVRKGKYARVIAVGPGNPNGHGGVTPPPVEIGDRILLLDSALAKTMEVEGQDILVINENLIVGVEPADNAS